MRRSTLIERAAPSQPLDEPLDDAAGRLAHLTFPAEPDRLDVVSARFGLLRHAGAPPASRHTTASLTSVSGATVTTWTDHFRRAAQTVGPPPALAAALELTGSLVPATAPKLALALHAAGLTSGVLHPAAVLALARLYGLPPPDWHLAYSRDSVTDLFIDRRWPGQLRSLNRFAAGVRLAGLTTLPEAQTAMSDTLPDHDDTALADVLTGVGLHTPGSTIVWDQRTRTPTRLLRGLTRALTVLGPTPPDLLTVGLIRIPSHNAQRRHRTVTADQLIALALEHPHLALTSVGQLALAERSRHPLSVRDQTITACLTGLGGSAATNTLVAELIRQDLFRSVGAALAYLHTAPYLTCPTCKTIGYLHQPPPRQTRPGLSG